VRWLWVSRAAYDLLLDERDRLRAKNDGWEDHVRRVERKDRGMTELPTKRREPMEPMPPELEYIIDKFSSETTRQSLRNQARIARVREGKPWSKIQSELESSLG
jgi:hypothetical protein